MSKERVGKNITEVVDWEGIARRLAKTLAEDISEGFTCRMTCPLWTKGYVCASIKDKNSKKIACDTQDFAEKLIQKVNEDE